MRIAVTASEPTRDSAVDPRFGRCPFFVIIDTETNGVEALENPNAAVAAGAGPQAAQMLADKGVAALLTGNCGPNAMGALSAAGIQVVVGCSGKIDDAVRQFQAGGLPPAEQPEGTGPSDTPFEPRADQASPTPEDSSRPTNAPQGGGPGRGGIGGGRGMGGGQGMGQGRGKGGGQGMGGGRGKGGGQGMGRGRGKGGGQGMGRGRGKGGGQGMGRGRGRGG